MDSNKILIVDDDEMMRLLLRETIKKMGNYEIIESATGQEAMHAFHQYEFQLILLDLDLPDIDGFDICSFIRLSEVGGDTPIVMVTGQDDSDSIERAYNNGATDFISKPINWSLIGYRLKYVLRSSENYIALRESEKRLEYAQDLARLGHWEIDCNHDQLKFSYNLCKMLNLPGTGYEHGMQYFVDMVHYSDQLTFRHLLNKSIEKNEPFTLETRIELSDDNILHVVIQGQQLQDGRSFIVGTLQDVTSQKKSQEKLTHIAHHDSLTDLPNRTLFHRLLEGAIQRSERGGRKVALLFVDLDRFKNINDSLGHEVGDELLVQVAYRLRKAIRTYDSVARLGGDEFAIILDSVEDIHDVTVLTHRIIDEFKYPFDVLGYRLHVEASIGISLYPDNGITQDKLLRNADTAMYQAKKDSQDRLAFYSAELTEQTIKSWSLENALREALKEDEFFLVYQPKVHSETGAIIGVEALIRWERGKEHVVSPVEFIPIAESTGLIVPIGQWVISQAIQQLDRWKNTACKELTIAVNVSALQLRSEGLYEFIRNELNKYQVEPSLLEIEITENALVKGNSRGVSGLDIVTAIGELGIRLALDDFGTGYSSFMQLKQLPVSILKIDKSFIDLVPGRDKDVAIVVSMINFARNLGLEVVAEGVETSKQLSAVKSYDCDLVQGYIYSRPVAPEAIQDMLESSATDPEKP